MPSEGQQTLSTGIEPASDDTSDEAPPDQAKAYSPGKALVVTESAAVKVAGMMALSDVSALNVSVDDLAGNRVAQKMVLTRAIALEAEVNEVRESNALLTGQVSALREQLARQQTAVVLARGQLSTEREKSRTREIFGGLGLAALSAGLGLVFYLHVAGAIVACAGALVTGLAYFASRTTPKASP